MYSVAFEVAQEDGSCYVNHFFGRGIEQFDYCDFFSFFCEVFCGFAAYGTASYDDRLVSAFGSCQDVFGLYGYFKSRDGKCSRDDSGCTDYCVWFHI